MANTTELHPKVRQTCTVGNGLERKPGTHVYLDSEKGKQKGLTTKEAKAEEEENQLIRMLLEEHQPKSKLKS